MVSWLIKYPKTEEINVEVFITITTIKSGKYSIAKTYKAKLTVPIKDRNTTNLVNYWGKSAIGCFLQIYIIKEEIMRLIDIRINDESFGSILYSKVAFFVRNW